MAALSLGLLLEIDLNTTLLRLALVVHPLVMLLA
jgi:hypothetical protein